MVEYLMQFNIIWVGIIASLAAGLATGAGSLPIFFTRDIPKSFWMPCLEQRQASCWQPPHSALSFPPWRRPEAGLNGASTVLIGILTGGVFGPGR